MVVLCHQTECLIPVYDVRRHFDRMREDEDVKTFVCVIVLLKDIGNILTADVNVATVSADTIFCSTADDNVT